MSAGPADIQIRGVDWKDAAKELPDDALTVLIHCPSEVEPVWLGWYESGHGDWFNVEGHNLCEVLHWAQMPEPPGGGK
jgi:hypothetical protein